MILGRMLTVGGLRAAYLPSAYLTRGADLTGIADGKQGLVSMWLYRASYLNSAAAMGQWSGSQNNGMTVACSFHLSGDSGPSPFGFRLNSTSGNIATIYAATMPTGQFFHIMASWDLSNTSRRHIYVDGVSDLNVASWTNATIDYTSGEPFSIAARSDGEFLWDGSMAEVYFATTYLDLSQSTNRLKFRTAAGKPADLGETGTGPTGAQPLVYLRDFGDFRNGRNRGSGGNFSVVGAPQPVVGPW